MATWTDSKTDGAGAGDKNHAVRRTTTGPVVPVTLTLSKGGYRMIGPKATKVATSTG